MFTDTLIRLIGSGRAQLAHGAAIWRGDAGRSQDPLTVLRVGQSPCSQQP
jgi:hypothetical protein